MVCCRNCYYYCREPFSDEHYDYSRSFCGLHGCIAIENPDVVEDVDRLNGGSNNSGYKIRCGYYPRQRQEAVQLSLFEL